MFEALANWLIYDLAGLKGTAFGDAAHSKYSNNFSMMAR